MRSNDGAGSPVKIRPAECRFSTGLGLVVLVVLFVAQSPSARAQDKENIVTTKASTETSSRAPQTYNQAGVSVEFSIEPTSSEKTTGLLAATEARVRFRITDTNGGKPLSNLRPVAWIDQRAAGKAPDAKECREKVQSFLQPGFNRRPNVDLNTYFILSLNHEPNISVIDPLTGFGGSKLYRLIDLRSSGEDWVMSTDQTRLYVSMPLVNQVAAIDTVTWKVIANIEAGARPARIALQHDNRYLWVGNDGADEKRSGVTVIDTISLTVAAQLQTGAGHHEIAFAGDDSVAFITNQQDGTLSVIDGRTLTRVKDIKVGSQPAAVAVSSLSKAVYVANQGDGTVVVVDGSRQEILTRMKAEPGLRSLRILPDGRFGFVVNPARSTVYVFDVSSNRVVHAVPVGPGADQITFTREFAYARSVGSEFVSMIKIADLGKEAAVSRFPAGERAPKESPASSLADAIVPTPEEGAVLVANPADKMIYFYTEGMAAPMGSFQNYKRDPKALLVLDNSLRETARGVYTTTVRLAAPGPYDVAFLLDAPRMINCFDMTVAENPAVPKQAPVAIRIEPLLPAVTARVGESFKVRFRVTDTSSLKPKVNLEDIGVLVFLAPGIWQQREWAKGGGEGVYEMSFVPPQPGVYYVYFQCPSLGVQFNKITPLTLQAIH